MSTATHDPLAADPQSAAAGPAVTPAPATAPAGVTHEQLLPDTATPETRTYRGRTVDELIPKIQADLGRDAIVIRRQSGLTGGFAGFFQRPYVEIEARRGSPGIDRYDEDDAAPALPGDLDTEPAGALEPPAALALDAELHATAAPDPRLALDAELDAAPARPSTLDEEFRELTAAGLGAAPAVAKPSVPPAAREALPAPFAAALAAAEAAVTPTAAEAAATSTARADLPPAIAQAPAAPTPPFALRQTPDSPRSAPRPAPTTPPRAAVSRSRARDAIERRLLDVGVGEELVRELLEAATGHVMPLMGARTSLARAAQEALRQRIPTPRALPPGNATIAVVGAGGSGKTSLCTALLDAYDRHSSLSAACATVSEGERRGALQLRLDPHVPEPMPVEQARGALRAARESGLLLLDTPAVSSADAAAVRTLAALLAELRADRVVLALPATLGRRAADQLLDALRPLGLDAIAITHADEADQLGVAIDVACTSGVAPVYTLEGGRGAGLAQVQPAELAERLLAGQ